jgi:hypothetical protein
MCFGYLLVLTISLVYRGHCSRASLAKWAKTAKVASRRDFQREPRWALFPYPSVVENLRIHTYFHAHVACECTEIPSIL